MFILYDDVNIDDVDVDVVNFLCRISFLIHCLVYDFFFVCVCVKQRVSSYKLAYKPIG